MEAQTANKINLADYDHIIVAFSGGKDSLACLLSLLDQGAEKSKIELWHHDIDGREGSDLMDWKVTRAYCQAVADAFELPIYFSWLQGGFEREMNRNNQRKAATKWENPDGTMGSAGGIRGKLNTRKKFPQVAADLRVRWCSAYLKIDVCSSALINQKRFVGTRTLVVTGERAEESSARSKYKEFEADRTDNRNAKRDSSRRHVDHYRPVHSWKEQQVWDIISKYNVNPHPAYKAGFGRVSCQFCIFGSPNQWNSARKISPERFEVVADYEDQFGCTIQRKETVKDRADKGETYEMTEAEMEACRQEEYNEQIILGAGQWELPKGAFGESCGPI